MTVAELGRRMSSSELTEWMALAMVEGKERQDAERRRKAVSGLNNIRRKRRK